MGEAAPDILGRLISRERPEDAVAAYYAWSSTGREVHEVRDGEDAGLLLRASTRFGPIAIVRASAPRVLPALLSALPAGRHYLMAPWALAAEIQRILPVAEAARNRVYHPGPGGLPAPPPLLGEIDLGPDAAAVRVNGRVASRCEILWRSPSHAEIAVATEPDLRRRGLARAAVLALAARLLADGVEPVYVASLENVPSIRLAESLRFVPCPEDEFSGYVTRPGPEGAVLAAGPVLTLRRLGPGDLEEVRRVYRENPRFFDLLADTREPPSDYVRREMEDAPPGFDGRKKFFCGLFQEGIPRMVGVVDFLVDYPHEGEGWLGILLVAEEFQSRGVGRDAVRLVESWAAGQGVRAISLGVELVNDRASRFWRRCGFAPTGEQFDTEVLGRLHRAEVLRRRLGEPCSAPRGAVPPRTPRPRARPP